MVQHNVQEAGSLPQSDQTDSVPAHVAIIMDGNRRWAEARGVPVFEGHRQGVEAVRRTLKAAVQLGIRFISIYSFSTENWSRPQGEVSHLMNLLRLFLRSDLNTLHKENVRIKIIGDRVHLDPDLLDLLELAESKTHSNTGLTLVVAFNYGSRQEVTRAVQKIALKVASGDVRPEDITPAMIDQSLDTHGIPDPDLVIRTSGEQRLSNFLLWQLAYAEFVFLPVLWPEFGFDHLSAALQEFNQRERRFGGRQACA